MKFPLKAASILLLVALVVSFVPAAITPTPVSAAQGCTNRAQFVTDVTVPDGTRYDPGTAFTKTWRLKNTGTCIWLSSYSLVFDSGNAMGNTTSVPFATTANVLPGQTIDVSVPMTAPTAAGRYIGYWKFKNSDGVAFGIGPAANKSWWVEINVTSTVPSGSVAYDFTASAKDATWSSGAGGLSFPGTDGDAKGFALTRDKPNFESGVTFSKPGLLFAPQNITNGFIQARYPAFKVEGGDTFQTTVGCEAGATSCYVAYRLDYEIGGVVKTFWTFREKFEGWTYNANISLAPLAGKEVRFILYISAYGSPLGDRALWGNPIIARKGIVPPPLTLTPPTATPSKTPGPVTVTVPPSACDRAQYISDVTIPDGTTMAPGATFTKTWRLKNVGACPWTTSYQLVFFSGEQMGAAASAAFPKNVAVGQTVDVSINMTAPMVAGSYRGYWMFKNASGALFGIGTQANKPWWVDIKVSGPTVTPGGPTKTPIVTPTGPTPTPISGNAFDFVANACKATWVSRYAANLPCPGTDGDTTRGFVLLLNSPKLESGVVDTRPALLMYPSLVQNQQDGYLQGSYPAFRVQTGDRFRATISCEFGATLCYAGFRIDYQIGTEPVKTFWGRPFVERYEGDAYTINESLNALAGKDVKFILSVFSAGTATGDRTLWVGPHIYRAGAAAVTAIATTPVTAVATTPVTAVATTPVTVVATTPVTAVATTPVTAVATTAVATTVVPTTPVVSNLYQNTKYNFKFTLPSGASIVSKSDTVGYVTLPIITGGTNLLEKYIQIHVEENKTPCVSPAVDGVPASTENVTINNIAFVKTMGNGAAAGNRYDWTAYTTTRNNACISLAFILHSVNPGNYATQPPQFDLAKESAVIGTTMSTYSLITP